MITLIISGGLGNQMFEYAAGRALSLRHRTNLSIDLYILNKKTKATIRNYELIVFNIETPITSSIFNKIAVKGFGLLKSSNTRRILLSNTGIFRDEKAQCYDSRFKKLSEKMTLFGYFQNENYFRDISEQLRTDFTFQAPLIGRNDEIRSLIELNTSVSIHIRRGDYSNTNSNLPILDISHYKKAIEYISSQISNPYFFIFSDDIDWVKNNLDLSDSNHQFIDWNKNKNSYIDMQLMSLCKHNIIANSSFSWWGAWLNTNPDKLVIAPDKWYKGDNGIYPDGFLPKEWIVL
ncbi:glycosyl transferase family 11 [Dysgonomonas alginatilytica]|uniref:Glycosyl transferase family 11 n=1 Tax=Dysgonomonas alginatilytica TaxID=1605892 RepID=A0A2V3PLE4_9BACT|nr:alpha-1,2-fucosyltransferase [Dysgonomonas alginatilytica]PXV62509.1 glycosyl transferase family 11 [Dysgonomonas alginatilytica]